MQGLFARSRYNDSKLELLSEQLSPVRPHFDFSTVALPCGFREELRSHLAGCGCDQGTVGEQTLLCASQLQ